MSDIIEGSWAVSVCILITNWLNPTLLPLWAVDLAWVIFIILPLLAVILIKENDDK